MKQLYYVQVTFLLLLGIASPIFSQHNPSVTRLKKMCPKDAVCSKVCLQWPIAQKQFWVSSLFGMRTLANGGKRMHYGVDLAAVTGTPVYAAAAGKVTVAGITSGYGKRIDIAHKNHIMTRYGHLSVVLVKPGQRVKQGQLIGKVGSTGNIVKKGKDGSHLHFEIYKNHKRIDPLCCLAGSPCGSK